MSEVIYLSNVRLSFPNITAPKSFEEGGKPMYSADFLMAPDHPGYQQFMRAVQAAALAKWNDVAGAVLQMIQNDRKLRCYSKGEERINKKTMQPLDGYAGMVVITAKKDVQPQLIDASGQGVDPTNTMACRALAGKLYGGCYVNVALKPWVQDNKYGKGVRCDFVAIQFHADGEPFGEGTTDASGLFAPAAVAAGAMPAVKMPWE